MIVLRTYSNAKRRAEINENKLLGQMAESGNHDNLLKEIANETPRGKRNLEQLKDVTQRGGSSATNSIAGKQKMGEFSGVSSIRKNSQQVPKYAGKRGAEIAKRRQANLEKIGVTEKFIKKREGRMLNQVRAGNPVRVGVPITTSTASKVARRLLKR